MSIRPGQKFDREQMWALIKEGKNDVEISKALGVSAQAIGQERKKLSMAMVAETTLEMAHHIVRRELDVMDQLVDINKHTKYILNDLLDKINKKPTKTANIEGQKDLRGLLLDAIKENRQQIALQVEIAKILSDYKVTQEFQKEVLDTIGNANKCPECGEPVGCTKCGTKIDLRTIIIKKLKVEKAIRSTVELTK